MSPQRVSGVKGDAMRVRIISQVRTLITVVGCSEFIIKNTTNLLVNAAHQGYDTNAY